MEKIVSMGRRLSFLVISLFASTMLFAQEAKELDVDIDVNDKGSQWYTQPWVWIVGVAVFILLLVALLRGSGERVRE